MLMSNFTEEGFREGDVETWYESVKEETFDTQFIELTKSDALALIAKYHQEATPAQNRAVCRLIVRDAPSVPAEPFE